MDFQTPFPEPALVSTMANGLVGSEILRIAADVRAMKAAGQKVLDLTVGDFAPEQFRLPPALEERVIAALKAGETNYPPSNGMQRLREAVVRLFERDLGLNYPIEGVVIAGGSRPLIYGAYRALVDPGETVVFAVPSWNNNHYAHLVGAKSVRVPTAAATRFLPTAADLAPHLPSARLLALCSPQNPTGTVYDAEALTGICDLVLKENARRGPTERPLFVLFDQVYWMLTFGSVRHVNPVSLRPAMAPYTIFVDGISKALAATGVRVGFGVGPPKVMARLSDIIGHVGAWAPRAEQVATAGFLDDVPTLQGFLEGFRAKVKERLDLLHHGIQAMKGRGLPVDSIAPMGAIYLTMQIRATGRRTSAGVGMETNDDLRKYLLSSARWAVVPFQAFALAGDTGYFRCSVGAVSADDIRSGLPRLEEALTALEAKGR